MNYFVATLCSPLPNDPWTKIDLEGTGLGELSFRWDKQSLDFTSKYFQLIIIIKY